MRLTDVQLTETASGARLAATVVWEKDARTTDVIEFTYRGLGTEDVSTPGDALATAVFIPCMVAGEDLSMDIPVCDNLLEGLRTVVQALRDQNPSWHDLVIDAPSADRSDLAPTEVVACFSGGIDSFFTAMRPRPEPITTLVTQLGRTLYPELAPRLEEAMPGLTRAAEMLGMNHLIVESNAFPFGVKYMKNRTDNWHSGAVVAAMALGMGARVRRCHVAAGFEPNRHYAWEGSIFTLDPLFSSAPVEIVHDGAELDRIEKVMSIAHSDAALRYLRVCTRRRPYPENCRVCDKCQWTALALQLAGVLDRCQTLGPVTPKTIRNTTIGSTFAWALEFEGLRERVEDREMRDAIDHALRRARRRAKMRPLRRLVRTVGLSS